VRIDAVWGVDARRDAASLAVVPPSRELRKTLNSREAMGGPEDDAPDATRGSRARAIGVRWIRG
jgi:hypothetical protein